MTTTATTLSNPRRATIKGRKIELRFPYDPVLIARIKDALPWTDRRFKKDDAGPRWEIDVRDTNVMVVDQLLKQFFQPFDQATLEAMAHLFVGMAQELKQREVTAQESRAVDAAIEIPGLVGTPYPFQRGGIAYAMKKRRTFLADEMGLGKTIQAIGTTQALNAYPCIWVTKASLVQNTRREWARWVPRRNVTSDPTEFGEGSFFSVLVISYNSLPKWLDLLKTVKWQAMICDESQYIKNKKAQRTEAALTLAKELDIPTRLALTGTPIDIAPKELIPQLEFLDRLKDFGGWLPYATRYCGAFRKQMGRKGSFWVLDGATNIEELHEKLRGTCYIRRTKAEVLPELPPKTRQTIVLPISNGPEYREADRDIVAYLKARDVQDEDADIFGDPDEEEKGIVEELARVQVLKKLAALGMAPAFEEWVEEFATTGKKIILFAHHVEVQELIADLCGRYAKTVWTRANGSDDETIQRAIDQFQNDEDTKFIVCSLEGDNAGHTLTAAEYVGFYEQGWVPTKHDQAEDRAHRIGQKKNLTCYYFVGEGTIGEDVMALLNERREVVEAVTDGKRMGKRQSGHIGKALLKRITSK